jgi:RND superfamily putative drug exporter
MTSRNLAARAGRWSAAHRKTAILGWIAFVVLATVIAGGVGQKQLDRSAMGNGESMRGELIVAAADFPEQVTEQVLVQGKGGVEASDPQVTAAVKEVVHRLERIDDVTHIESPLAAQDRARTGVKT